jgi:hypothetical protein
MAASEPGVSANQLSRLPDEYKEVVTQFRALTDIRFKLLALLPLGTVATIFLSKDSRLIVDPAIAAFAFVATISIATYNKRNDQHYDELVGRAAQIERDHGVFHGAFTQRPRTWLCYGRIRVEHRWPLGLLYASTAALWAYLFVNALCTQWVGPGPLSSVLRVLAPAVVIQTWRRLRAMEKSHANDMKTAVREVIKELTDDKKAVTPESVVTIIAKHKDVLSCSRVEALLRLQYHWNEYQSYQGRRYERECLILSSVIDLPARWIQDICFGRREDSSIDTELS